MTSLHEMVFGRQLELLQRARAMIGVNGGQINALFFLPEGCVPLPWRASSCKPRTERRGGAPGEGVEGGQDTARRKVQ